MADARLLTLRRGLAYEARVTEAHLEGYARVPRASREVAQGIVWRLRRAAAGQAFEVYLDEASGIGAEAAGALLVALTLPGAVSIEGVGDAERGLRAGLAYEAGLIGGPLVAPRTFPAARRPIAAAQADRMMAAASGKVEAAWAGIRHLERPLAALEAGA